MTTMAPAPTESRLSIPSYMRARMWAMPAADVVRNDRKADMALQAAEASMRRGFLKGAESAHRQALALCESLPMALRVADSAEQYGFSHLGADALALAVSLAHAMPDVRFVLSLAQQRRYADVVASACSRLADESRTVDGAIAAAETALTLGLSNVVRSALHRAECLAVMPHERRQVERSAQALGVVDVA